MKKLFAIVAMMGLFATILVYVFDEKDNEPVAGDVQGVQGDEALESEEPVEQEEAEEPVDKNVLVDKLADAEKNKKAMYESLAGFKKAFDKSVADYMKLQKDSTVCCANLAKFEEEKTKLADNDAIWTEELCKMKIARIAKNVEVIFDSKKDNNAYKTALKKDNEQIVKKEKEVADNKKKLDAKIKAIADEKAKYEAMLPNVNIALLVKDSLGFEVQSCELKSMVLNLEIECLKLNIALGEENATEATKIKEKLEENKKEIEKINAEIEELLTFVEGFEEPEPIVEEVPVEAVTEGGIIGVHKVVKRKYIGPRRR